MWLKQILFAGFILLVSSTAVTGDDLITFDVVRRVFFIRHGDSYGSSFTIDVDSRQYLISAKHVVAGLQDTDSIQVFHDSTWKWMDVKRIDLVDSSIDITVLAPGMQLSPPTDLQPTMHGICLSQGVFFLGFPFGDKDEANGINDFPLPFVKKGILSALFGEEGGTRKLYIDGYVCTGFSGGPIVFKDPTDKKFKVAGVVSGYRQQPNEVREGKRGEKETSLIAITNSGIMIGCAIDAAVEAIKRQPIGVETKTK